jgi:hypothetical protein
MRKRIVAATICAVGVMSLIAGSTFAGEVTGHGTYTPIHSHIAASVCSFPGREDIPESPLHTQTPHEVWLGPVDGVVNPPPGTRALRVGPEGASSKGIRRGWP